MPGPAGERTDVSSRADSGPFSSEVPAGSDSVEPDEYSALNDRLPQVRT